jgi:hypothetical protein
VEKDRLALAGTAYFFASTSPHPARAAQFHGFGKGFRRGLCSFGASIQLKPPMISNWPWFFLNLLLIGLWVVAIIRYLIKKKKA